MKKIASEKLLLKMGPLCCENENDLISPPLFSSSLCLPSFPSLSFLHAEPDTGSKRDKNTIKKSWEKSNLPQTHSCLALLPQRNPDLSVFCVLNFASRIISSKSDKTYLPDVVGTNLASTLTFGQPCQVPITPAWTASAPLKNPPKTPLSSAERPFPL